VFMLLPNGSSDVWFNQVSVDINS